ncbi:MAG: adenosylcobinamide-GDP ribazoletransferase, partial [Planctomycetota bacterium]|nr:adenosylcobinamide-GDP ribazoletransferase [Planctomycetota bacterium]
MKSFFLALQFLTRLSIRIDDVKPGEHPRAMMWFPLVGLVIGSLSFLVYFACMLAGLPPEISAGLLIVAMALVTGGLHLDGLSDTADGFYAGRDKESVLRIMDDTHTGAMGVIAIVGVLVLKYGTLVAILREVPAAELTVTLLVVPV